MLYMEIIAVCSEIHTEIQLCGQNEELLNVEPGGTYSDQWALKGYCKYSWRRDFAPTNKLSEWELWLLQGKPIQVRHSTCTTKFCVPQHVSTLRHRWLVHCVATVERSSNPGAFAVSYILPINTADTKGANFHSKSACTQWQARSAVQQWMLLRSVIQSTLHTLHS